MLHRPNALLLRARRAGWRASGSSRSSSGSSGGASSSSGSSSPAGMQEAPTTQLTEFAQRQLDAGTIDFAAGQPGPSLLPLELVARAAAHRLAGPDADRFMLQYGPEQGYASFRACLASFLGDSTGTAVEPDELLITAGVSHGLDLACRHLAAPGDTVLVERPTYFLAGNILRDARLEPVAAPCGPDGLDVDGLERLLQQPGAPSVVAMYLIPVHNNPTGTTLPLPQRERLLELAHRHGFCILADEVYQLLSFPDAQPPPPPMRAVEQAMQAQGRLPAGAPASRVVSLGSFSKILAPGLRLGWVHAAPHLLERLRSNGVLRSGGSIAPLASGVVHSALQLGLLQQHLHGTIRPTLARNCAALCEALRAELPGDCSFLVPSGGFFCWLRLPDSVCSEALLEFAAARHAVKFTPGRVCDGLPHMARLSYAFYSPHELREGARRLGAALREFQQAVQA